MYEYLLQVWPVKANHEQLSYLIFLSLAACKYPGQPVKDDGNLVVGFPQGQCGAELPYPPFALCMTLHQPGIRLCVQEISTKNYVGAIEYFEVHQE